MKIKKEHKELIIWGIVILAVGAFLMTSNFIKPEKFTIYDDDFVMERTGVYDTHLANGVFDGTTININYAGFDYNLYPEQSLYFISNVSSCDISPSAIYKNIPTPVGTNRICRVQYNIINDNQVDIQTYSTIYTREVNSTIYQNVTQNVTQYVNQTVNVSVPVYMNVTSQQLCEAVSGTYSNVTCTCPNGDKWFDNSTLKKCGSVTVTNTETKEVPVEQTFFQKYGLALIILVGAIVIILYVGRKK